MRLNMDSSASPTRVDTANRPNTDSMVTVPLSDVQSNADPSHPDWNSLNTPQTPVDGFPAGEGQANTPQAHNAPLGADMASKGDPAPGPSIRLPDGDTPQADDAEGDVVDWAQLEKTEEQEPRGEQSDEVSRLDSRICESANSTVNRTVAGSPRAGEQCPRYKSQVWLVQCPPVTRVETLPLAVTTYH